jgi:hypothetical protein
MTATAASACYRFGRFEPQPDERRLLGVGAPMHIGPRAFDLLIELIAHLRVAQESSGQWVTKDELLKRVCATWLRRLHRTCERDAGRDGIVEPRRRHRDTPRN